MKNSTSACNQDAGRSAAHARLRDRYEQLWSTSIGKIRAGEVDLDPVLQAQVPDLRRGFTLIGRPSQAIRQRLAAFLKTLQELEPDQYYYAPTEFHLTVLSLFTATVHHAPFLAQAERYVSAVDAALRHVAPIGLHFEGITASPSTVMVQGFCPNDALNHLRDALRNELRSRGLGEGVDQRYRLETAHMTVARFRAPLQNSARFAAALERARHQPFGAMSLASLCLVKNDWYMTRSAVQIVKRYRLSNRTRRTRIALRLRP